MFTVGLYTICIHGLNLYTGKVGYAPNQPAAYLLDLLVIWAGNLAGTGMAALGVRQTRISGIADKAAALCEVKLQDSMASLFLLAVFCGFLMFIAVDGYKQSGSPDCRADCPCRKALKSLLWRSRILRLWRIWR